MLGLGMDNCWTALRHTAIWLLSDDGSLRRGRHWPVGGGRDSWSKLRDLDYARTLAGGPHGDNAVTV